MKVKRKVSYDIKDQMIIHVSFHELLEEYSVIVISSIVAYLIQNNITVTINENQVYHGDTLILDTTINQDTIDCILNYKLININPRMIFIGIQTYFNIYFNLYETNQYHKVKEFYRKNKKK